MRPAFQTESSKHKNLPGAILVTGLFAGTLDITAAVLQYLLKTGSNPVKIFNYIASSVFGKEAYGSDLAMPLFGLLLHYLVAISFSALFFLVYPRIPILAKNIVLSGLIYGIVVWLVMNLLVVPFSRIGRFPSSALQSVIGCLILMFAIGLPIAILAYRFYLKKSV